MTIGYPGGSGFLEVRKERVLKRSNSLREAVEDAGKLAKGQE